MSPLLLGVYIWIVGIPIAGIVLLLIALLSIFLRGKTRSRPSIRRRRRRNRETTVNIEQLEREQQEQERRDRRHLRTMTILTVIIVAANTVTIVCTLASMNLTANRACRKAYGPESHTRWFLGTTCEGGRAP